MNKKGVSLAVLSAIFIGIFLLGVYFYFGSGNLTGKTTSENLFGRSELGITGNTVRTFSGENPSCVGATKNFTCGDMITESCTMNGNLVSEEGCFSILTSDIVLDCAGYSILGNFESPFMPSGVRFSNGSANGVLKNCILSNFYVGVSIYYSNNNTLLNNSISYSFSEGIYLGNSENNFLQNNSIFYTGGELSEGLFFYNSSNNLIEGNLIFNNSRDGIRMYISMNNSLRRNQIFDNSRGGIVIDNTNNSILTQNLIFNNSWNGVEISFSWSNFLEENVISENYPYGIESTSSINNTFFNNSIINNLEGISIFSSNDTSLLENFICDNLIQDVYVNSSFGSFGNKNACTNSFGWSEEDKEGCSLSCKNFSSKTNSSKRLFFVLGFVGVLVVLGGVSFYIFRKFFGRNSGLVDSSSPSFQQNF